MAESCHLEKRQWCYFSAVGGSMWMKFGRLGQNDTSSTVMWSKSKPEVEFQYGERLIFQTVNSYISAAHLHCVSKKARTLASCSFDKHGLILMVQHQHTFENDMHVQLSLSLHLYLLYLLLNSKRNATEMTRSDVPLCSSSSKFSRKHRTLSLQICVLSAKQSGWLPNFWTDAGTCVHCTTTMSCLRHWPLWPVAWSSASLTHGQAYHKTSSTKQFLTGESNYVQAWGKRMSLWTSASLKPALFRANTRHNRLFVESSTVYRWKHVVSRHFGRSHLKTNKVSKSEGTRKVKYAYHFWNCADAVDRKLSKLTHASRRYSLPKLARFLRHSVAVSELTMKTHIS